MRSKRTRKQAEETYYVVGPSCCKGYGYVLLADIEGVPYDREACWCPIGKAWAARNGAAA